MNRTAMMFLVLGLAASQGATTAAAAPEKRPATLSPSDLQSALRLALSGYEPLDAQRDVQALVQKTSADDVTAALLRMIREPSTPGILRLSAIAALGDAPAEAGRAYLHEVLGKLSGVEDERVFTLSAALRALGGFSAGELPRLSPYLHHKDAGVRESAALSLARCAPSSEVLPLLHKRLASESDRGVQETLRSTIGSLSRPAR